MPGTGALIDTSPSLQISVSGPLRNFVVRSTRLTARHAFLKPRWLGPLPVRAARHASDLLLQPGGFEEVRVESRPLKNRRVAHREKNGNFTESTDRAKNPVRTILTPEDAVPEILTREDVLELLSGLQTVAFRPKRVYALSTM